MRTKNIHCIILHVLKGFGGVEVNYLGHMSVFSTNALYIL